MKTLSTLDAVKASALTLRLLRRLTLLTLCASALLALPAGAARPAGSRAAAAAAAAACDAPELKATKRFPAGKDPRHVAPADFNGDGLLDLAVANQGAVGLADGSVLILLGEAGSVFKTGATVNAGLNPRFLVPADFNKDGKTDLAAIVWASCCSQGAAAILLGDGAGNFTPTGTLHAVGVNPTAMAVGDFNGDGNPDLVAMAFNSSFGASILLGNGAGGFAAAGSHPTAGNSGKVVVGDFNLDGKLDIVTANSGGVAVTILIGNGAGGFAPAKSISLQPDIPAAIVAGDFNLDGKPDVATASTSGAVHVLTGDGAGNFSVGTPSYALSITHAMTRGDFNADGKPDVAVTTWDSAVSVLLGDGAGGFAAARNFDAGTSPISVAAGDFDQDGKTDLVASNALGNAVEFIKGEGTGDFRAASVFRAGMSSLDAARGDFNADGRPDIAVANNGQNHVSILLGSGGGRFTAAPQVSTTSPSAVAVADFNGDGRQDLAIATGSPFFTTVLVALGDGAGGFGTPTPFNVGTNPRSLAVADFDGDGDADIAAANADSASVSVLLGDGAGGFAPGVDVAVGGFPFAVIQADFNRDCYPDLVVLGGDTWAALALGDGTGKFAAPVPLSHPLGTRSAAAGDLDGDGNTDLVFAHSDPAGGGAAGAAVVLKGDGAGGFGAPTSFGVGRRRELTSLADFNGDGRLDIAVLNLDHSASVLLNAGGGAFSAPADFPVTSMPSFFVAGDFSGDGSPDILTRSASSNVSVLLNSCAGAARAARAPAVQFSAPCFGALESRGYAQFAVTRTGDAGGEATVDYATSNGTASDVSDYTTALGRLRFAPGETEKTVRIIVADDAFVEPAEFLRVALTGASGAALGEPSSATVTVKDSDVSAGPNPITQEAADHAFFVRQHYADFLNREPDPEGLNHWRNEIASCGADAACVEARRINVSAAFFLSIEFQETGFLAYRAYKAAYGDAASPGVPGTVPVVRLREFLADTQQIGRGVRVNVGEWRQQLEANKDAYVLDFVGRQRFRAAFPETMTADEFVSKLDQNAGGVLSADEKGRLVSALGDAPADALRRAAVLRQVAEDADLRQREFNRAFVLMQYFGYLRRDPDAAPEPTLNYAGWRFWLDKLEQFGGDFVRAEMVKAFLSSDEYRRRFGQ